MLNRLRKRLNYANIVATAALFMGLGGVGYAATASKNSVRSSSIVDRQVKNQDIALNAITTGRIRNGNVANADLATNAVSSVKIANGTIGVPDLSAAAQTSALHCDGTGSGHARPARAQGSCQPGAAGRRHVRRVRGRHGIRVRSDRRRG